VTWAGGRSPRSRGRHHPAGAVAPDRPGPGSGDAEVQCQDPGWPGNRVQSGVAGAEAAASLLGEAGLQAAPDRALADVRAADHSGIDRYWLIPRICVRRPWASPCAEWLGDIEG
jgi:hypothetical protein